MSVNLQRQYFYLQGAIMESLDSANLTDDDDDKAVNRKLKPPSMLRNSASIEPHPELIGDEMISLSLRADAENNHVRHNILSTFVIPQSLFISIQNKHKRLTWVKETVLLYLVTIFVPTILW